MEQFGALVAATLGVNEHYEGFDEGRGNGFQDKRFRVLFAAAFFHRGFPLLAGPQRRFEGALRRNFH